MFRAGAEWEATAGDSPVDQINDGVSDAASGHRSTKWGCHTCRSGLHGSESGKVKSGKVAEKRKAERWQEAFPRETDTFSPPPLTGRIQGYWDRSDTEIDLVAVNETDRRPRFGSCKRSASRLLSDVNSFCGHVARFLDTFLQYGDWQIERVGIAPRLSSDEREVLKRHDVIQQDLVDLTEGLT